MEWLLPTCCSMPLLTKQHKSRCSQQQVLIGGGIIIFSAQKYSKEIMPVNDFVKKDFKLFGFNVD